MNNQIFTHIYFTATTYNYLYKRIKLSTIKQHEGTAICVHSREIAGF